PFPVADDYVFDLLPDPSFDVRNRVVAPPAGLTRDEVDLYRTWCIRVHEVVRVEDAGARPGAAVDDVVAAVAAEEVAARSAVDPVVAGSAVDDVARVAAGKHVVEVRADGPVYAVQRVRAFAGRAALLQIDVDRAARLAVGDLVVRCFAR